MSFEAFVQLALYFVTLTALAVPVGEYMERVYLGRSRLAQYLLGPWGAGFWLRRTKPASSPPRCAGGNPCETG